MEYAREVKSYGIQLDVIPHPFLEIFTLISFIYLFSFVYFKNKNKYLAFSYILSSIHALMAGGYGLYMIIATDILDRCVIGTMDDNWLLAHIMVAYLLADALYVAMWLSPISIVGHHLVASIGIALASKMGLGYGIFIRFALTELSTLPLNMCWYLNDKKSMHFKISGSILIIIYFLTRIIFVPEMLYTCYPEMWYTLPWSLFLFGMISVGFMMFLNIFWFVKIIKRVIGSRKVKTDKEQV